jgi:hypothetical protein
VIRAGPFHSKHYCCMEEQYYHYAWCNTSGVATLINTIPDLAKTRKTSYLSNFIIHHVHVTCVTHRLTKLIHNLLSKKEVNDCNSWAFPTRSCFLSFPIQNYSCTLKPSDIVQNHLNCEVHHNTVQHNTLYRTIWTVKWTITQYNTIHCIEPF